MEVLWFLNTLVTIRVACTEGHDGLSVLEHRAPAGDSPPLHVHRTEDEIFCVLDGELRLRIGGEDRRARAHDVLCAPRGVPHTYRVDSPHGATWLTVTAKGDFERFVRVLARPAAAPELPPPSEPTQEALAALAATAARFGIEIVGPPLG